MTETLRRRLGEAGAQMPRMLPQPRRARSQHSWRGSSVPGGSVALLTCGFHSGASRMVIEHRAIVSSTEMVVILRHSDQKPRVATGRPGWAWPPASIGLWHSCGRWTWPASEDTPFLTQCGASGKAAGRGAFSKLYSKLSCREWLANLMALSSHVTPRLAPEFSASLCIFLLCHSLKEPDRLLALVAFSSLSPACPDAGTPGNTAPGFFSLLPWIVLITTWSLGSRWSRALTSPVCMDRWALWAHGNGLLCQEEQGTSFILENHQRGLD